MTDLILDTTNLNIFPLVDSTRTGIFGETISTQFTLQTPGFLELHRGFGEGFNPNVEVGGGASFGNFAFGIGGSYTFNPQTGNETVSAKLSFSGVGGSGEVEIDSNNNIVSAQLFGGAQIIKGATGSFAGVTVGAEVTGRLGIFWDADGLSAGQQTLFTFGVVAKPTIVIDQRINLLTPEEIDFAIDNVFLLNVIRIIYGSGFTSPLSQNIGRDLREIYYQDAPLQRNLDNGELFVGNDVSAFYAGSIGADIVYGGGSGDILDGAKSSDFLYGGFGNDLIDGGAGADNLSGGDGNDSLAGGSGSDQVFGMAGNDLLTGNGGDDFLTGDEQPLTAYEYNADGSIKLEGEELIVSHYRHTSAGFDQLFGGAGDDTIIAGDGDDSVIGGSGDDFVFGGFGADEIFGGNGDDALFANSSGSRPRNDAGDSIFGGGGSDTLGHVDK